MSITADRRTHWEKVYQGKAPTEVSWYQPHLALSLELIAETGIDQSATIIDVGGGTSTLVDDLLAKGYTHICVLDISAAAIAQAQARLHERAALVEWIEADITQAELRREFYDLWHDRAVFHFLTDPDDRARYVGKLERSLKPGGHLIIATFSLEAPPRCSGLEVMRYSPATLHAQIGRGFELVRSLTEAHRTPSGKSQNFIYCHFRKQQA